MEVEVGTAQMPIVVGQHDGSSSPPNFPSRPMPMASKSDQTLLIIPSDYNTICKTLDTAQGELLDCRVQKPHHFPKSTNWLILPKEKTHSLILAEKASVHISKQQPIFTKINERLIHDQFLKVDGPRLSKKRTRRKKEVECFKCQFCPLMTLKRDMMVLHGERKGACATDVVQMHCPGCANVFFSTVSLRVHLAHDHNMVAKDVKAVLQHLPRVNVIQLDLEEKSSCVYNSGKQPVAGKGSFDVDLPPARPSCANVKTPSLLETYLDDISNKIPPRMAQGGADLLENTFNFTAPVSEQLPSIQPENPPNTCGLDKDHLMEESNETSDHYHSSQRGPILVTDHNEPRDQDLGTTHSTQDLVVEQVQVLHESQLMVDQSQLIQTSGSHDYLTMPASFSHEETYTEERLEEYVYIDGEIPVVRLDGKPSGSFELLPSSLNDLDDKYAVKKITCGFRCDINGCKFRLQSEDNIKYHRRCHEGQLYNCPECCKDCPNWVSLSSHLWQKHKIDMELYKCDLCPYRTPSYSRLTTIHRGIHSNARPFLCDACGKGFKTVKQMRNHKIIHKAKMVRSSCSLECNMCGRSFVNKRVLAQHIGSLHNKLKPFLCSTCGYTTAAKHSLVLHLRKHTGEKPHKCDKCNYQTGDHNALRRHKMKHSGQANYKCCHCSYTCIQASTYKMHVKQKHPGLEHELIFSCQHCTFETLQRGNYLAHMAQHQTNDPLAYYPNMGPVESDTIDVVETIVDLSNAQSLLEDGYYEMDGISDSHLQHENANTGSSQH